MVSDDAPSDAGARSGKRERTAVGEPSPRPRTRTPIGSDELIIVPANEASWTDLQTLFGSRGDPARCWCQRFRMSPGESWASEGPAELAARLREQTACDQPGAGATSGLVGYLDGEPVGWCAVAPRPDHLRMLRNNRVPWDGRDEDKSDDTVWALTCFLTRRGYGGRGVSHALARAAVAFARSRGARAIEGYPDLVEGGYVGTRETFAQAGFIEVHQPTKRKVVMRLDL
ncbi:GNAT family N-acetyltransferase [Microlunatus elymi]|uniref:GNAT family N-acetyltransferase n=1 Tax=Microlunatus elymi TaxID=2596828 RepID=A0A516Q4E5_9ACTN|nr:GNAT family N-acetyltransferase [Microlunatus elymi]QDP98313.1 GNAT family N-acetyltransferase [Microlunatus elymi]